MRGNCERNPSVNIVTVPGENMATAGVINQYSSWQYQARIAAVPDHQGIPERPSRKEILLSGRKNKIELTF